MPLSCAGSISLNCPTCGVAFQVETWLIVDANERPDLVARILDGSLQSVRCPACGESGQAPGPVLFHDGHARRVLFAVPPGMPEDEWHEAAETLLWMLIGELPRGDRDPYLGDLQAEAGLAGLAAVIEGEGLAGSSMTDPEAASVPIVMAIRALLAADGPDEIARTIQRYPVFIEPQTIAVLRELAFEAFKQGENEAGRGFGRAADILNDVRELPLKPLMRAYRVSTAPGTPDAPAEDPLDDVIFALLRSHTAASLAETVDLYPQLLHADSDAELVAWAARARATGKQRLADGIDERRAALAAMRVRYEAERPVFDAVQALLGVDTPEGLEAVLVEHDALFTDAADAVLGQLVMTGDDDVRAIVRERRDLVQRIRQMLPHGSEVEDGA